MAKHKKKRLIGQKKSHSASKAKPSLAPSKLKSKPGPSTQTQHTIPTIPFLPMQQILLIGEGDLSFAASLITHHACTHLTASVLEKDIDELTAKYPHVGENVRFLEEGGGRLIFGLDVGAKGGKMNGLREMDRIIFNFPHVGGKSTDVNRQVRYNQELLVSFFKNAIPSLAPGGSIIVTLFEGEPYTLWNIRDLARHSGLQVDRSFKFQASAYPGYHHSRTLGVVKSQNGEIGGGWKGEDRPARSYVFLKKDEQRPNIPSKRKKDLESSDED